MSLIGPSPLSHRFLLPSDVLLAHNDEDVTGAQRKAGGHGVEICYSQGQITVVRE